MQATKHEHGKQRREVKNPKETRVERRNMTTAASPGSGAGPPERALLTGGK